MAGEGSRSAGRSRLTALTALAAVSAVLFGVLSVELEAWRLGGLDAVVTSWVQAGRSPAVTAFMRAATALGSAAVLVPLALLAAAWVWRAPARGVRGLSPRQARLGALFLLTALAGSWVCDSLLKLAFHRARPGLWPLVAAPGYSYPSGHATSSAAFYLAAAYLVPLALGCRSSAGDARPRRFAAAAVRVAAVGVTLLVGTSRIYLGVHYPSDVLGGYLVGGFWACLCLAGFERLRLGS